MSDIEDLKKELATQVIAVFDRCDEIMKIELLLLFRQPFIYKKK
mgnify:CR=1 FL=1